MLFIVKLDNSPKFRFYSPQSRPIEECPSVLLPSEPAPQFDSHLPGTTGSEVSMKPLQPFHRENHRTFTWLWLYDEGLGRLAVIYHPKSVLLLTKIVHCSSVYDLDYVYFYQLVSHSFMHSGTVLEHLPVRPYPHFG